MSRLVSAAAGAMLIMAAGATEARAYDAAAGKAVYEANCSACHKMGIMGAPKTGDVANWAPRIAQGMPTLVKKSIDGYQGKKGMMPAKGGNTKLTDAEVGNAVAYMVEASK